MMYIHPFLELTGSVYRAISAWVRWCEPGTSQELNACASQVMEVTAPPPLTMTTKP